MITEKRNPRSRGIQKKSILEILKIINEEDKKVPIAIGKELKKIAKAVELVVDTIKNGGNIYIIGAGTSGRLGILQQAEMPPTFNIKRFKAIMAGGKSAVFKAKEGAEDSFLNGKIEIQRNVGKKDLVIGVSASGRTPFVIGALEEAKRIGCKIISVVCNKNTQMSKLADVTIEIIVGPEIIAGSTRMKSGTAQKMVLDMITTASMIKLGKVYDNLMVDVVATNEKLKKRAESILIQITGMDKKDAKKLLEKSKYNVRLALIMWKHKCDIQKAKKLLKSFVIY